MRGKVAYRLPDDAGSANISWDQQPGKSRLRLSGPLGVGTTEVTNEGALLRVRREGIERLYPADAAPWLPGGALLPIPVDSIRFWLRGVPDPTDPVEELVIEDALAQSFAQSGWVIRYEVYDDVQGLAMPNRLTLEAPAVELNLRLILRAWELSPRE